MGSQYVINGSETIEEMGYLNDGATIPAGKSLLNNGDYTGSPVITSIAVVGTGVSVVNPATPGTATITIPASAASGINLGLSQYSLTNFNANNFNFQGVFNLIS